MHTFFVIRSITAVIWHRLVKKDLSKVYDMVDFFEKELEEAQKEVKRVGVIETLVASLPGIFETRFSQLQEIESVLTFLEIEAKRTESEAYKKLLEHYKRALTSSDIKKYIESDPNVVAYAELRMEVAYIRNKYMGVMKALETKNFALGNVVKLRAAGIEDARID